MLSNQYLETALTLLRVAGIMADRAVADRLKALAGDYERKAEQFSDPDAALSQPRKPALPKFAER